MRMIYLLTLLFFFNNFHAQEIRSLTMLSHSRVDKETAEETKQMDIFNVSEADKIVVHNRIKPGGEITSQVYRLIDLTTRPYKDGIAITLYFKSHSIKYQMVVVKTEDELYLESENYYYAIQLTDLKTYGN